MEQSPTFFDPTLFLLFGFMILIYFLMIRPENKRRKTHQEMLASLDTGEEIVTAGGILGKVTKISELDNYSDNFLNYLVDSKRTFSIEDILGNSDLIPTIDELYDPINWATRTSMPPI